MHKVVLVGSIRRLAVAYFSSGQSTEWAKMAPFCMSYNFTRYWPIFKILSLSESRDNLQ